MGTVGEPLEYRCLVRATDGKKTISTSVCTFTFSLQASVLVLRYIDLKVVVLF